MAAVHHHLKLVEALGQDHPETKRAMLVAMELAPDEIQAQLTAKAKELDLIPEAMGYLADGSPMFSLHDMAKKLGMSTEEAESALKEIMAEREALGLPSEVLIDGDERIHKKQ